MDNENDKPPPAIIVTSPGLAYQRFGRILRGAPATPVVIDFGGVHTMPQKVTTLAELMADYEQELVAAANTPEALAEEERQASSSLTFPAMMTSVRNTSTPRTSLGRQSSRSWPRSSSAPLTGR